MPTYDLEAMGFNKQRAVEALTDHRVLDIAFVWRKTPEGYGYWSAVYDGAQHIGWRDKIHAMIAQAEVEERKSDTQDHIILGDDGQKADIDMLTDALSSVETQYLFDAVLAHIEARPDVNGDDLERFSDALRRIAWQKQR